MDDVSSEPVSEVDGGEILLDEPVRELEFVVGPERCEDGLDLDALGGVVGAELVGDREGSEGSAGVGVGVRDRDGRGVLDVGLGLAGGLGDGVLPVVYKSVIRWKISTLV